MTSKVHKGPLENAICTKQNSERGGIAVKDINYYLELKFGFGMRINLCNYGVLGLKDFLESLVSA